MEDVKILLKKIKQFIKRTRLYPIILRIKFIYLRKFLPDKLNPSASHNKRLFILQIAKESKIPVFVETGTYLGDTINFLRNDFEEIYSIELDKYLAERAKKIFKKYKYVHIFQGDSTEKLPQILENIKKPVLFWLDAHYSGGITVKGQSEGPLLEELQTILRWWVNGSIILIDDANYFLKKENYRFYIDEINTLVKNIKSSLNLEIISDLDIIKIS